MSPSRNRSGSRVWRYAPLLFWIGIIVFGSGDDVSASNTSRWLGFVVQIFTPDISDERLSVINLIVRKTAHFTVYATLALLAARAFLSSSHEVLRRRWMIAALIIVAVCAFFDEYHQTFSPARTGTIYDALLDITGGAFALAAVRLIRPRLRRQVSSQDYS